MNRTIIMNIALVGDASVGKSSMLYYYKNRTKIPMSLKQTIGFDVVMINQKLEVNNNEFIDLKINIWDTGGAERYECLMPSIYRYIDGFIVTFDVTNKKSLDNVGKWLEFIKNNCPNKNMIYIVGNKIDIEHDDEYIHKVIKKYGYIYMETCATEGANVIETFEKFIRGMYALGYYKSKNNEVNLETPPKPKVIRRKKSNCICI